MSETITGWLLDVYANEADLRVWIIAEDGRRLCFGQAFSAKVYAAGPDRRLRNCGSGWRGVSGRSPG